ncbi:MbtH family protein [Micromonospora sp. NPDC047548]|uniref:MbtH family protein n=1 Tax=Micromonospora sp. NPDC047548 TaxID=3155624 RepID=UPI0033FC6FD3
MEEASLPDAEYRVVVNNEDQYSIWPTDRPNPNGWNDAGFAGSRADCLAHVDEVWRDLRPRSLRGAMDVGEAQESRKSRTA